MKTTICSSDIKSKELMEKMHLGEFHFIDFGSFEFINDLTEFIKNKRINESEIEQYLSEGWVKKRYQKEFKIKRK
jgi:hypothetical protein